MLRLLDFFYYKEHLFIVSELLRENLFEVLLGLMPRGRARRGAALRPVPSRPVPSRPVAWHGIGSFSA